MSISQTSPLLSGDVSRRDFLAVSGGLSFAVVLGAGLSAADSALAQANEAGLKPNVWVTIGTDDSVVVMIPTGEMGQGTTTALPLILAEELADAVEIFLTWYFTRAQPQQRFWVFRGNWWSPLFFLSFFRA